MKFPIAVGFKDGELTFVPELREVPLNQAGQVVWNPVDDQVAEITGIHIEDAWPYEQPTRDDGKDTWSTDDPNEENKRFKYSLSAKLPDGTSVEADPEILNRGKTTGGSGS